VLFMRILNIGSLNIDYVYAVDHFVRPGETLASLNFSVFAGGKGFNQSIALARAGAAASHAGKVGKDGAWLVARLEQEGVDASAIATAEAATGHAIIQVIPSGENAIVLHGGANQSVSESDIARALARHKAGDYLLVQNEISSVADAIRGGAKRGMKVVFNPAPISPAVRGYPLDLVDLFILNETEAEGLTEKTAFEDIRAEMRRRFPKAMTVLTLGGRGAVCFDAGALYRQPAFAVNALDTTAAGDTFTGYFLAGLMEHGDAARALELGCRAAAICVTRPGAADSIPLRKELEQGKPRSD